MDRQMDGQTDRKTDKQTDISIDINFIVAIDQCGLIQIRQQLVCLWVWQQLLKVSDYVIEVKFKCNT